MVYHTLSQLSFVISTEVNKTNIINFYLYKCENRLSGVGACLPSSGHITGVQKPAVGRLGQEHTHDLHKLPPTLSNLYYTVCDPNSTDGILQLQKPRHVGLCVL